MFTAACMFMCSELTTWDWANCVGIHPWRKLILYLSAAIDHRVGFPLFMLKHCLCQHAGFVQTAALLRFHDVFSPSLFRAHYSATGALGL